MSTSRHQRRKAAKAKAEAKLVQLAQAERSRRIAETVRANKNAPVERNYYPPSSMGNLQQKAATARVTGHASGVIYKDRTRFARFKG